ncbi:hypothetical protein RvY_06830 [Ramazzottius varieornatus]|uniref:Uncharacterized protein n=1 Tax=Ramazzottius varieornatus TaxID=947166 RepID=A0A1D1V9H0_RAMVA|nr:hypothetical protein RvY_06830 [Ramazzottius varieornatus]
MSTLQKLMQNQELVLEQKEKNVTASQDIDASKLRFQIALLYWSIYSKLEITNHLHGFPFLEIIVTRQTSEEVFSDKSLIIVFSLVNISSLIK